MQAMAAVGLSPCVKTCASDASQALRNGKVIFTDSRMNPDPMP